MKQAYVTIYKFNGEVMRQELCDTKYLRCWSGTVIINECKKDEKRFDGFPYTIEYVE